MQRMFWIVGLGLAGFLSTTLSAPAQDMRHHVVIPQFRVIGPPTGGVNMIKVEVEATIRTGVSTTQMDIYLHNSSGIRQEAQLIAPVPEGSAVRGFAYQIPGGEPKAELLPKDEARRIYMSLVSRVRDPGLAEFIGYNLIQSNVFPVEANSDQKVTLTYENILPQEGARVDFVLPRSESLSSRVPWNITVHLKSDVPISTVYSPSHAIETDRRGQGELKVVLDKEKAMEPGPFRLSYLVQREGVAATVMAYPDPKVGGGYFLLLAGLPVVEKKDEKPVPREITLVLDRSGSMAGEKIEQVKKAAFQIISGLDAGEAFNVLAYNDTVEMLSEKALMKDKENVEKAGKFLDDLSARSGTNIHDALVEALRQTPGPGRLPIVLFLTDGLPTVGETREGAIRDAVLKGNAHHKRIFAFGVGHDVNTPLLERISRETRAKATFVHPREDVEVKVGDVFRQLVGPVLTDARLETDGGRVRDLLPPQIPDLFEGDQVVLLGQYTEEKPVAFRLSGKFLGKDATYKFELNPSEATTRNSFVPRLWANRKVGYLMDEIRQSGADGRRAADDPKTKELVDEVIRLSKEYGILTEYTAFLIREEARVAEVGQPLPLRPGKLGQGPARESAGATLAVPDARGSMAESLARDRSGPAAVAAEEELQRQKASQHVTTWAVPMLMDMMAVGEAPAQVSERPASPVQYAADRTFHLRDGKWIDSRILDQPEKMKPKKTIEFASDEYMQLAERLAREGRAALLRLSGDILLELDGETVLIKAPQP